MQILSGSFIGCLKWKENAIIIMLCCTWPGLKAMKRLLENIFQPLSERELCSDLSRMTHFLIPLIAHHRLKQQPRESKFLLLLISSLHLRLQKRNWKWKSSGCWLVLSWLLQALEFMSVCLSFQRISSRMSGLKLYCESYFPFSVAFYILI